VTGTPWPDNPKIWRLPYVNIVDTVPCDFTEWLEETGALMSGMDGANYNPHTTFGCQLPIVKGLALERVDIVSLNVPSADLTPTDLWRCESIDFNWRRGTIGVIFNDRVDY